MTIKIKRKYNTYNFSSVEYFQFISGNWYMKQLVFEHFLAQLNKLEKCNFILDYDD